jgi:hypothetical protein
MKSFNRVVVGIKFDEYDAVLKLLGKLEFLKSSEVYLVHVSTVHDYHMVPDLNLPFYPSPESKIIIEQAVLNRLNQFKNLILPPGFDGVLNTECLFSTNPKKRFCEYVTELKANLVILMAEKKHLPFGSFIHYQFNHLHTPIFILKPLGAQPGL